MKVQEVLKYQQLDNLTKQEGWPILLAHIKAVQDVVMKALLVEEDSRKLMQLQERYRAFDSIISTLQSASNIKLRLFDDIKAIDEDEKLREEFDI